MKSFWIFLLIIKLSFAQKCSLIGQNFARCQNVESFMDIANELQPEWMNLEIVNRPSTQFNISNNNVAYVGSIEYLELSRAGKLNIADGGFREFDSLTTLNISNGRLEKLQPSWFLRKNIITLTASKNKIVTIKKEDMRVLTKVKSLNLSANAIEMIEANAFSDMKQLENLRLYDNQIKVIIFGPIENLKYLNLRDNSFQMIKNNMFARLTRLEKLTLCCNRISEIQDNSFMALEKLKILNISGNDLTAIRPGIFAGLIKAPLMELDLSKNNIQTIAPTSFDMMRQISILDLSENSLIEVNARWFVSLNRLKYLMLQNNDFKAIQSGSFQSLLMLDTLDLSRNEISIMTAAIYGAQRFSGNRLRNFNLANNKIDMVGPNFLTLLTNLESIDFSQNELKTLPAVFFRANVKLKKIYLDNNNLDVLPNGIFDTVVALEEIRLNDNKLTFLPSARNDFPRLQSLTFENNPWQCPCLKEITKWSLQKKLQVNQNYYDGSRPSCVVTPVKSCVRDATAAQRYGVFDKYLDALGSIGNVHDNDDEF